MKLRARLLLVAMLAAVPVAVLLYETNEWLRARDMRRAIDRVIASQMTDDFRERCDSNPNWFIAGPRADRPSAQVLAAPDADVLAPRPPTQELPFEYFAYDDTFTPLSSAGPRFPAEFRQAMRSGSKTATQPFVTSAGTGVQQAVMTGWQGSPCAALLFRMRPFPGQGTERALIFFSLLFILLAVALVAGAPIVWRIRHLGLQARQSASEEYRPVVSVGGRDEMSALAFAFNEAGADIRRRSTDVKDREESLRRYIANTTEAVTEPLEALEQRLGAVDRLHPPAPVRIEVNAAVGEAHTLAMRLQNLAVAATLRMSMESPARDTIDLNALVQRVIGRQDAFSRAANVKVTRVTEGAPVSMAGDVALLEQAVNNLVDNAIRYNRAEGQVIITLDRTRDGRFSLRVADDGPGAPDEVLARLNANRRFRGDEGRTRQPGELGLGLAIVREVSDRLGIKWAFRRSAKGWFEAELTGAVRS